MKLKAYLLGKVGYEGTSDEATLQGKAQGKADLRQLQLENAAKNKIELQSITWGH